jgi:hypothetical protein
MFPIFTYWDALAIGHSIVAGSYIPGIHTRREVRRWVESYAMSDRWRFLDLTRMDFSGQYREWCKYLARVEAAGGIDWEF